MNAIMTEEGFRKLATIEGNDMFTIEKNLPIPKRQFSIRSFPFHSMEVGDSFLVANEEGKLLYACRGSATRYKKKTGKAFTIRKLENGEYRCWRVA